MPKEHTDIILTSVASICHELGLTEDALKFATMAFKINFVEPSTNFLLALLHYTNANPIMAMYYMKNVLRVEPEYYDGKAELLLKTWACRIKLGKYKDVKNPVKNVEHCDGEDIEKKYDPNLNKGIVCSLDENQCKTASIQCVRLDKNGHSNKIDHSFQADHSYKTDHFDNLPHCHLNKKLRKSPATSNLPEGSGEMEPDQSQLESFMDYPKMFQIRISLERDHITGKENDFYVTMSVNYDDFPEATFHVRDETGNYKLTFDKCNEVRELDWMYFTYFFKSYSMRNIKLVF